MLCKQDLAEEESQGCTLGDAQGLNPAGSAAALGDAQGLNPAGSAAGLGDAQGLNPAGSAAALCCKSSSRLKAD
jgi:hypothetical protein